MVSAIEAGISRRRVSAALVIALVYSFNDSRLNAEWVGFTLDWYRKLADNNEMLMAAGNSLVIALVGLDVIKGGLRAE
jgi:ABC-type spermidine/putrescine transport system permease subunit II